MSPGVLNNIAAVYAENNLNSTQASLQNTLEQLSSGSRINSGADDAAGPSIADGLGAASAAPRTFHLSRRLKRMPVPRLCRPI